MKRKSVKQTAVFFLLIGMYSVCSRGESFYLVNTTSPKMNWSTLNVWNSERDGSGSSPVKIDEAAHFYTNQQGLRTPTSPSIFPGKSLTLENGRRGTLLLQAFGETKVKELFVAAGVGGNVTARNSGVSGKSQILATDLLTLDGGLRLQAPSDNGVPRRLVLKAAVVKGDGDIVCGASGGGISGATLDGKYGLAVDDATQYSGDIIVAVGTFVPGSDFVLPQSALKILSGAKCCVNQTVEVAGLFIDKKRIAAGTYEVSRLAKWHPDVFSGTGKVIVR